MSNVYVNLVGGVGNQLFQIAAGYAYSRKYGKNLCIDSSRWAGSQGSHPDTYKHNIFQNFLYSSVHHKTPTTIIEKRFNYDELPYHKGDVVLSGYFQSLKYFQEYAEDFKSLLVLPEVDSSWITKDAVAFHIRRGDYLVHHNIHLICGTEYFKNQFHQFSGKDINVFTDDKDRVFNEFYDSTVQFNIIDTAVELKALTLISKHANIVGSNSSFSWWASFLGEPKNKIIVPDHWFKNFEDHDDIYRADFTRVAT